MSGRCRCDRCWPSWPDSEVPAVRRTWLAFEPRVDVALAAAHGAVSCTEHELLVEREAAA